MSSPRPAALDTVTVTQVLATETLHEATVVGGSSGLGNAVLDVVLVSSRDRPEADPSVAGAMLVIDASESRFDSYLVDVAIRAAHQSGASALMLCSPPNRPAVAATRLAEKLQLPLIVVPRSDPLVICDELRRFVRTPFIVRSDVLLGAIDGLRRLSQTDRLDTALATLGEHVRGTVALLGSGGAVLAGEPIEPGSEVRFGDHPAIVRAEEHVDVVQPLQLAPRERATFWLVCRLPTPSAQREAMVVDALAVAGWYVATRLVADRLERERDARFRLGVLNAIMGTADRPDPALLEQLGVLGWRVDGWCTGIHVTATGEADALSVLTRSEELTGLLASVGIRGAMVERPDGWSIWLVDGTEPPARAYVEVVKRVRLAAERFVERVPRFHVYVGVGRPYQGLAGLRSSLEEALEAATIARASGEACEVRHIDEMGLRRILLGWYTSESFAELARTLLGPVLDADRSGALLMTLETYLDCESSATEAAARLALHRNTVINRVERLRSLLTVDLDDPDERLAVQLACRVAKLGADDRSGNSGGVALPPPDLAAPAVG